MEHQSFSDDQLIELTRSAGEGDLRAYDSLVERHQDRVLTNCRHLTRSADAEDLAQEIFVKAYFALDRFEGRSAFGTWIQRIKVNHCLNHLRRQRDKTFVDVADPVVEAEPELAWAPRAHRNLEREDRREAVRAVLDSLPESLRVPLLLRDLDEMSYQEIADEMGLGLSAVKMRIKRGRELFRERFESLRSRVEV